MIARVVSLIAAAALGAAPVHAEPRAFEGSARLGFSWLGAPGDCSYCASINAPGLEAGLARPLAAPLVLHAQGWFYQGGGEGRAVAGAVGLGARSGRLSARALVGAQWSEFHESDGGPGDAAGVLAGLEVTALTGRFACVGTELALRYTRTFDRGGFDQLAVSYGVTW